MVLQWHKNYLIKLTVYKAVYVHILKIKYLKYVVVNKSFYYYLCCNFECCLCAVIINYNFDLQHHICFYGCYDFFSQKNNFRYVHNIPTKE